MIQREPSNPRIRRTHQSPDGPVRTCVGCRKRELAVELLRVVAESAGDGLYVIAVDGAAVLPGRGAWVHPSPQCVEQAVRRRAFTRALRITGSPDTSAVSGHVDSLGAHRSPGREQVAQNMSKP